MLGYEKSMSGRDDMCTFLNACGPPIKMLPDQKKNAIPVLVVNITY